MKPQVIALGLSGLVGSRISELLSDKYDFISLTQESGIDISRPDSLTVVKKYEEASYVLHLAAKTDVDGCEEDKKLGEQSDAWRINVWGTANVSEICRETGKKIIYISTDFVFDGKKKEGQSYTEEDIPNPQNFYALTKYEGEKAVEKSGADYVILRIAYPYRAKFAIRKDFARSIKERLENNQPVKTVANHIFCPTFIDDLAGVIDKAIENDLSGIYHAVGASSISPLDACNLIADVFDLNRSLISKTTREEFFKDRAFRPFNLSLSNGKIEKLGVIMRPFKEGLSEIRKQLNS
ncbi:MAG: dTDP-4-dehydrorhamnose reductase [Candidatus Levybacteria bacterium GW2011_GWA2_40_8]|nr:MAG: dTDP-4-dehydrorhamnose reductase [Candidatus Levybacteria bacterium GW2011_GWA2_40_8]